MTHTEIRSWYTGDGDASDCCAGGFPETSAIVRLGTTEILTGPINISKDNKHVIVNLFFIYKYSRFVQRHRVLALLVISTRS